MQHYSHGDGLAASVLPQSKEQAEALLTGKGERAQQYHLFADLWPHYFTFACLAFFGPLTIMGISLAQERSVTYWVGDWGYLLAAIPLYLAVLHVVHLRLGGPKMVPVILATIVPCFVTFGISNCYLQATGSIPEILASRDCTTFATKQDVQRSWLEAVSVYEGCVNRTARERGISNDDAFKVVRFHECSEWQQDTHGQRSTWLYLKHLEETTGCSGWCWATRPIWTYGEVKDACSASAGALLRVKAQPLAAKMMCVSLVGLFVAIIGVTFTSMEMRAKGHEWERF